MREPDKVNLPPFCITIAFPSLIEYRHISSITTSTFSAIIISP